MNRLLFFIFTYIFFIPSNKLFAEQAPDLGSSASYAIFSANGSVIDTGQSPITGNIGTNNGSISGFKNIYGDIHDSNEFTVNAANDLLIAYNFLDSAIPTQFIGPIIGNGDTLTAGVYSSNGISTLRNILYLDGGGDANAVFIIQISGALTSLSQAKVKLINEAQAGNVFWKVDGDVKLLTGTFIRGSIIANNGDIVFSVNDTLEGRALTTKGSVSINQLETSGTILYVPSVPLNGELWILIGAGILFVGTKFIRLQNFI